MIIDEYGYRPDSGGPGQAPRRRRDRPRLPVPRPDQRDRHQLQDQDGAVGARRRRTRAPRTPCIVHRGTPDEREVHVSDNAFEAGRHHRQLHRRRRRLGQPVRAGARAGRGGCPAGPRLARAGPRRLRRGRRRGDLRRSTRRRRPALRGGGGRVILSCLTFDLRPGIARGAGGGVQAPPDPRARDRRSRAAARSISPRTPATRGGPTWSASGTTRRPTSAGSTTRDARTAARTSTRSCRSRGTRRPRARSGEVRPPAVSTMQARRDHCPRA